MNSINTNASCGIDSKQGDPSRCRWWTEFGLAATAALVLLLVLRFDTEWLRWYFALDLFAWLDGVEQVVSADFNAAWLVGGCLLCLLGSRRFALHMGLVMLAQWLCVRLMKHVIGRVRPVDSGDGLLFWGPSWEHTSYPSGHAAAGWAVAFMLVRRYPRWRLIWVVVPIVVSWARLHGQAHFVGDLLAGLVIGFSVERTCWWLGSRWMSTDLPPNAVESMRPWHVVFRVALTIVAVVGPILASWSWRRERPAAFTDEQVRLIVLDSYQQILRREPAPEEPSGWIEHVSRRGVVSEMVRSMAIYTEFVQSVRSIPPGERAAMIYERLLARSPSEEERARIAPLLADDEQLKPRIRLVVTRLMLSEEYFERFGSFAVPAPN